MEIDGNFLAKLGPQNVLERSSVLNGGLRRPKLSQKVKRVEISWSRHQFDSPNYSVHGHKSKSHKVTTQKYYTNGILTQKYWTQILHNTQNGHKMKLQKWNTNTTK